MHRHRRYLAIGVALAAAATRSPAADWRITGFFSQGVTVGGNFGLDSGDDAEEDSDDIDLRASTNLGLAFRRESDRTALTFAPGLRLRYTNAQDADEPVRIDPRFNGRLDHQGLRYSTFLSASVVPREVNEIEIEEFEPVERDATQIAIDAAAGGSYQLTLRDAVSLTLSGGAREYVGDESGFDPTRRVSVSLDYQRQFRETVSGSVNLSNTWFSVDGDDSRDSRATTLSFGLDQQLTSRFGYGFRIGGTQTSETAEGEGASGNGDDSDDFSVIGGANARYAFRDSQIAVSFDQSVDQNIDGDIENRSTLAAQYQYTINSRESVSLSGRVGFRNPALDLADGSSGDDDQTLAISAGYNWAFAPDWSLSVGYNFRALREDGGDLERSNSVTIEVSRGLDLLP